MMPSSVVAFSVMTSLYGFIFSGFLSFAAAADFFTAAVSVLAFTVSFSCAGAKVTKENKDNKSMRLKFIISFFAKDKQSVLFPQKKCNVLHMMGLREHIHRKDFHHVVMLFHQSNVPGLRSGVTTYIHDSFRGEF